MYPEQAGRQKNSELISIFRILPLLGTLVTLFATTIVCGMSNRAKELDFLRLKEKQFNIRKRHAPHYTAFVGNTNTMKWLRFRLIFSTLIERIVFIRINAFLQDMEYSRQSDYNTEILRGHWLWTTAMNMYWASNGTGG